METENDTDIATVAWCELEKVFLGCACDRVHVTSLPFSNPGEDLESESRLRAHFPNEQKLSTVEY